MPIRNENEVKTMRNKTILFGMLILLVFAVSAASAENRVYFDPQDSDVPEGYCNTTTVLLKLDATDGIACWGTDIVFDPTCVNITGVDFTGSPFDQMPKWEHYGDHIKASAMMFGTTTGDGMLLATLTIHCNCKDCDYCKSSLEFTENTIGDDGGVEKPATWISGTVTCGKPEQCLGTCCTDPECTDPFAENMPCSECIAVGKYWHPNKDAACFNGVEPFDLCLDWCPECCDSADNDTDGDIDYPADRQCSCGLDPSETESLPPIPELPTLALAGIGILGIALLARKRD